MSRPDGEIRALGKRALVLGAGGFIGAHLARRLKAEGFWVRGVDLVLPEYRETAADDFVLGDLRDPGLCRDILDCRFDEIYQLAADMGGAGYVFSGENDADIMHNSAAINLNILNAVKESESRNIFYSSSACVYPEANQLNPDKPVTAEDSAYPAQPDSDYGWEKLFSERLYFAFARNYGLNVSVARYHNIFGPEGTWTGGREKAPAALCRKVALADEEIEIWGDGQQTRSFLYIDECLQGTVLLMRSAFRGPVNIGSSEMVTINHLAQELIRISGKSLRLRHIPGPLGVRGRNSDNRLLRGELGWEPTQSLRAGLEMTYAWVERQARRAAASA